MKKNIIVLHVNKDGQLERAYTDTPDLKLWILDERAAAETKDDADSSLFDLNGTPVLIDNTESGDHRVVPLKEIDGTDLEQAMDYITSTNDGVHTNWREGEEIKY